MIVIADSTPLNYLILIHQVDLLPQLFDRILIPPAVFEELQHQETPDVVRGWIARPPSWLHVQALRSVLDPRWASLIRRAGSHRPRRGTAGGSASAG
jgi:predicted nucleic acid-binding protein